MSEPITHAVHGGPLDGTTHQITPAGGFTLCYLPDSTERTNTDPARADRDGYDEHAYESDGAGHIWHRGVTKYRPNAAGRVVRVA